MSLPAVLLPQVVDAPSYAQALVKHTMKGSYNFQLWVPVTLHTQSLANFQLVFRMCGENHHLAAALCLEPSESVENPALVLAHQLRLLHVALGCNIRCVVLPTAMFLKNKRGYPTLSKSAQTLLSELLRRIGRTVRVLVQGPACHELPLEAAGRTGCLPYLQYLQHLRRRPEVTRALDTVEAQLEATYLDVLQRPLQPLKDHLDFRTYEVFEKDPVKYAKYQEAIFLALRNCATTECQLFVVGAGRGPLVTCALNAYQELLQHPDRRRLVLSVVAVEKNPSAVLFLQARMQSDPIWRTFAGNLHLLHKDLRSVRLSDVGGRRCDIVVSELLGSFGDNELSPECLDAFFATEVCHPATVSIPRSYTAYISLACSATLHLEAQNQALYPNDDESGVLGMQCAMETPYVVRTHAVSQMYREKPCWTFHHPAAAGDDEHSRMAVVEFPPSDFDIGLGSGYGASNADVSSPASEAIDSASCSLESTSVQAAPWTLTGLLGTFVADLYSSGSGGGGEVCQISTAPHNFSTGMFSWFPLYFPVREPLPVPPGAGVRVHLWRTSRGGRVWYEWSAAVVRDGEGILSASPIHNPEGRSSHIAAQG